MVVEFFFLKLALIEFYFGDDELGKCRRGDRHCGFKAREQKCRFSEYGPEPQSPALSQTEKGRVSGMKNSDRNALYLLKLQLTNHCIAPTPKENPRDSVLIEKLRNLMTFELPN